MFEYEVITPQTATKFKVKALTYGDELKLRSALMATNAGIISHFNNVLYNSLTDKPQEIQSFDDFLSKITVEDRVALTFGLYHTSYGDTFITETVCPSCGSTNEHTVKITKLAKGNFFNGKPFEFLQRKTELDFKDSEIHIVLSPATLIKEQKISEQTEALDLSPTLSSILLYTEELTYKNNTFRVIEHAVDIISALKLMIPRQIRQIVKKLDYFTKYKVEVPYKCVCPKCKHEYVRTVDFVTQLFREVIEA